MKSNTPKVCLNLRILRKFLYISVLLCLCGLVIFLSACSELEKPETKEFYSETAPPLKQEFRWSNGKMPKSFDPAKASAPPETDIVRAIYDGLTETDPKSLEAVPAIATDWESTDNHKVWTFKLRKDAVWSNGKKITANDFVDSWKRLAEMGKDVSHHELLKNIVGMRVDDKKPEKSNADEALEKKEDKDSYKPKDTKDSEPNKTNASQGNQTDNINASKSSDVKEEKKTENRNISQENTLKKEQPKNKEKKAENTEKFGVKAVGDYVLEVVLRKPDKEFPKLVAHPVFRPVYGGGKEFEETGLNTEIVTNGAFRIVSVDKEGIALERAKNYWNKEKVKLEKVRFIQTKDADSALEAYRSGKVDAVTNVNFEPLALKLLEPYFDFQTTTHSALNFYEFNRQKPPFNDRRVRQALAISIERKRLTEDELDGATKPAFTFLPFTEKNRTAKLTQNVDKAKELFEKAGFPNGKDFPTIKLVVNRNNIQQRIAKSVAKMWEKNLNVKTEIVVREFGEIENIKHDGDFDILRRGVVLPTADETANMLAIFKPTKRRQKASEEVDSEEKTKPEEDKEKPKKTENTVNSNTKANSQTSKDNNQTSNENLDEESETNSEDDGELVIEIGDDDEIILTEEEAITEVPAIPLYFPMSYSLVKPYVKGFEMNTLDAPLLKDVEINSNWKPKNKKDKSP